jgi:hypothetical protein
MKQAGGERAREEEPACRVARCAAELALERKDDDEDVTFRSDTPGLHFVNTVSYILIPIPHPASHSHGL